MRPPSLNTMCGCLRCRLRSIPCAAAFAQYHVRLPSLNTMCGRLRSIPCAAAFAQYHVRLPSLPPSLNNMCGRLRSIPCAAAFAQYYVRPPSLNTMCGRLHSIPCAAAFARVEPSMYNSASLVYIYILSIRIYCVLVPRGPRAINDVIAQRTNITSSMKLLKQNCV